MGRYCKLPPSAVEKININGTPLSKKAPQHPDGWFLCLPAHCASLWDRSKFDTFDDAIHAAGGVILDEEQAFESQRGNLVGRGDADKSDHSSTSGSEIIHSDASAEEDREENDSTETDNPGREEGDER